MINLLQETESAVLASQHQLTDIVFIGSKIRDFSTDWETFKLYSNFDYDNGFGLQRIINDLVVVFSDGSWLERNEYDGAENWIFKSLPKITSSSNLPNSKLLMEVFFDYV